MEERDYSTEGMLIAADFWGVNRYILNDVYGLTEWMKEAAIHCGANVLKGDYHRFSPSGVTIYIILSESHISVHTYPDKGFAAFDVFTCGSHVDPEKAVEYLQEKLNPLYIKTKQIERGRL